jgi:hypothetical protein
MLGVGVEKRQGWSWKFYGCWEGCDDGIMLKQGLRGAKRGRRMILKEEFDSTD